MPFFYFGLCDDNVNRHEPLVVCPHGKQTWAMDNMRVMFIPGRPNPLVLAHLVDICNVLGFLLHQQTLSLSSPSPACLLYALTRVYMQH